MGLGSSCKSKSNNKKYTTSFSNNDDSQQSVLEVDTTSTTNNVSSNTYQHQHALPAGAVVGAAVRGEGRVKQHLHTPAQRLFRNGHGDLRFQRQPCSGDGGADGEGQGGIVEPDGRHQDFGFLIATEILVRQTQHVFCGGLVGVVDTTKGSALETPTTSSSSPAPPATTNTPTPTTTHNTT